jgi:FkbM family methyltransferase
MKKVFIDGGAHKGEAIEVLLDKREDLQGCEVHFYEPNEDLIELLEGIATENTNYDITIHHAALWKEDGQLNLLKSVARWGSLASTVVESMNEIWGLKLDRDNPQGVKAISLSNLLNTYSDDDYIVVKLDIEGSEYAVVGNLIETGALDKIDELFIEWHDHFFPHYRKLGNDLRAKLAAADVKINNDWM